MHLSQRLLFLRALSVAVLCGAAGFLVWRGQTAAVALLILPALKARRWLRPYLAGRRALSLPTQAYDDEVLSLHYPAGWSATADRNDGVHTVELDDADSFVHIVVQGGPPQDDATGTGLCEEFLRSFKSRMTVHDVAEYGCTVLQQTVRGTRAFASSWQEAGFLYLLPARTPDGRSIFVASYLSAGAPEGLLTLCLSELWVKHNKD